MPDGDGIFTAVRRTERRKTGPTRRCEASELDCLGEEEEEGTAILLPRLDLLLVVCNVGGKRRRLGQRTAMAQGGG